MSWNDLFSIIIIISHHMTELSGLPVNETLFSLGSNWHQTQPNRGIFLDTRNLTEIWVKLTYYVYTRYFYLLQPIFTLVCFPSNELSVCLGWVHNFSCGVSCVPSSGAWQRGTFKVQTLWWTDSTKVGLWWDGWLGGGLFERMAATL